ncbi:hypothetical protein [Collimonas sp. PA-H2]|uniref:hypothetical protein n=1 Tax=Collimonas sp. PA-H2 TaxID=1881062 RepID=UPI00117FD6B4|nr:hypothetical protein [Collimonas sp. PA-H2]
MKILISKFSRWIALFAITSALVACAIEPRVVDHSFAFDAIRDSPEIEVLDYRYGDSKLEGAKNPDWVRAEGRSLQMANTNGPMRIGDSLYVKWRLKSTGEIYQDTVDLRRRLPSDMKDQRIYFIVKGSQLYVYLILEKNLDPNPCMLKGDPRALARATHKPDDIVFALYCFEKITPIYPDQSKN